MSYFVAVLLTGNKEIGFLGCHSKLCTFAVQVLLRFAPDCVLYVHRQSVSIDFMNCGKIQVAKQSAFRDHWVGFCDLVWSVGSGGESTELCSISRWATGL